MHRINRCWICVLSAAMMSVVALTVHAGEVLQLKAGKRSLEHKVQTLSRSARQADFVGQQEFVVQFQSAITPNDKARLHNQGFKILSYIPDDALVVFGEGSDLVKMARSQASIRSVARFQPDWKISSNFDPSSVFNKETRVRVMVRMADQAFSANLRSYLEASKEATVRMEGEKLFLIDVPRSEVEGIANVPGVEWVEPAPEIKTMDFDPGVAAVRRNLRATATGFESGTKVMNFDAAWTRGFAGQGQTVAMADTGLDSGNLSSLHKDLAQTKEAYSVTFLPFTWSDSNGHGTHVAGSVIGNGAMSSGQIRGGANQATFFGQAVMVPFLGILDPQALQDPNKTVGRAYDSGARIHTNSWGADAKGAYDGMAAAFDDYLWNHPEMLMVFANGNSGTDANSDGRVDEGSVGSPASAKNVLSVGASENLLLTGGIQAPVNKLKVADQFKAEPLSSDVLSNNPNGMAVFSSRGPTADGRIKPDIVAPGTNIVSTRSSAIAADKEDPNKPPLWGEYDANYLYCGGTSMATPLAAGAATVARQFLNKQMGVASPSGALVKATLVHTAFDMFPGQYGTGPGQELPTPRPNNHEGYGRVDMDKLTKLGRETMVADETAGVGLSDERTYAISVEGSSGLVATLAYTDAPGAANAAKALVNDIDLVVEGPNGQVMTKNDHVNNLEMVEAKLGSGRYVVKVKGVNIPNGKNGKQPFALLVSPL